MALVFSMTINDVFRVPLVLFTANITQEASALSVLFWTFLTAKVLFQQIKWKLPHSNRLNCQSCQFLNQNAFENLFELIQKATCKITLTVSLTYIMFYCQCLHSFHTPLWFSFTISFHKVINLMSTVHWITNLIDFGEVNSCFVFCSWFWKEIFFSAKIGQVSIIFRCSFMWFCDQEV